MRTTICSGENTPLILHIIRRLAVGGLENGLVNLINHMPRERYRHAIVCLTDFTDFRHRIQNPDVQVIALHKREGNDFSIHSSLWKLLRRLRPKIVHTRNIAGLECLVLAALAGIPGRIHGEHGLDACDLGGHSFKYNLLRRMTRPVVHRYITVSATLGSWLGRVVACADRVTQIYNGVDKNRFQPRIGPRMAIGPDGFAPSGVLVVGTVGRMQSIKDQLTLVRAFIHLLKTERNASESLRLVIVGEGPLRDQALRLLHEADAKDLAWLPGERDDIPEIMKGLDLFVLPSLSEGISNTILEAMASGLPVIATCVGGNPELIEEKETGLLVPPADPIVMADAIRSYLLDRGQLARHGQAGRKKVEARFSIETMVSDYLAVYDAVLNERRHRPRVPEHERVF